MSKCRAEAEREAQLRTVPRREQYRGRRGCVPGRLVLGISKCRNLKAEKTLLRSDSEWLENRDAKHTLGQTTNPTRTTVT